MKGDCEEEGYQHHQGHCEVDLCDDFYLAELMYLKRDDGVELPWWFR